LTKRGKFVSASTFFNADVDDDVDNDVDANRFRGFLLEISKKMQLFLDLEDI
jgi:hypothetical protein